MSMELDAASWMSGLILLTIFGNAGLNKLSPKEPKKGQKTAVIREILTTREIVRDSGGSSTKSVTCPYCTSRFVILK